MVVFESPLKFVTAKIHKKCVYLLYIRLNELHLWMTKFYVNISSLYISDTFKFHMNNYM